MKTKKIIASVLFVVFGISFMDALAQGGLTPPGSPAPTMKTLDQVEPRTPISVAGYEITQSGSYYLTTNLNASGTTAGITVNASNVTLDLNGFTVSGAAATGNGVSLSIGVQNVLIENGAIRDCTGSGIVAGKTQGCEFRDLRVLNHSGSGISGGYNTLIENCAVRNNDGFGIYGVSGSRIVGNIVEDNNVGIYLAGTENCLQENTVKDNNDNYSFSAVDNQLNLLLCEVPETLDWPCSVKFTGTLTCKQPSTNGIIVNSDNVTIDMDGHALIGPGESSGHGIYQDYDFHNLTVLNGKVVYWNSLGKGGLYLKGQNGILEGIAAQTNSYGIYVDGFNWTLRACVAAKNVRSGIYVFRNNTLENCSAWRNQDGIHATDGNALQNCVAYNNALHGFDIEFVNTLQNCSAYSNSGDGFRVKRGNSLQNCSALQNSYSGFYLDYGNNIHSCSAFNNFYNGFGMYSGNNLRNCVARNNTGHGFSLYANNRVASCLASMNGYAGGDGSGIYVHNGYHNRIEDNNVIDNDFGINVLHEGNFILRNTCSGNTTNWMVVASNVCLVVDAAITGSVISGDSGGTAPGSTDPNANFTY